VGLGTCQLGYLSAWVLLGGYIVHKLLALGVAECDLMKSTQE